MTPLGKVVRTTAFRLSAIYLAVFSLFSVSFILYLAYSTNVLLNNQVRDAIAEVLDKTTLADLIRRVDESHSQQEKSHPLMYYI